MRRKGLGYILVVVLLGAIIGSVLGEVFGLILPAGVVRDFFLKSATFSVGPAALNLIIISITLGFSLKINVIGILGIAIAAYLLKYAT